MTSAQLRRRAEARGVTTAYRDWRDRRVQVSDETLMAVLDALGPESSVPRLGSGLGQPVLGQPVLGQPVLGQPVLGQLGPGHSGLDLPGLGQHTALAGATWPSQGHPSGDLAAPAPPQRGWGFTVQLYSLRSRRSWGHGDLRDLADLATWSGHDLGAAFVLINPLHAAEPVPPVSPSPYQPMSRRFVSPLYLRIEDIPEYALLPAGQRQRIEDLAAPLRARNTGNGLIDRDAVWTAKRAALEIIHAVPLPPTRRAALERFCVAGGRALGDWAVWCALAEIHGPDWRTWPDELRNARSAAVAKERERLGESARFHAWLQWVAAEQRAAAQAAARSAGMSIGVIGDLAVGAHPGGADTWALADVLATGVSAGAPPDEFNPRGQDWALSPWHPGRLAAAGYQPLADLVRAGFRYGGGLRADHVMGLFRLWWIPRGMAPGQGTYVRYRHEAMVGVLVGEAARAGALAVGEDLGTVDPWIRDYLMGHRVLGTSMLWFERLPDGRPLPPSRWRPDCLATVGTHDVPPAAAFVTGEHVALRARLGLLAGSLDAEREQAAVAMSAWRDALAGQGLLQPGTVPSTAEFVRALYGYLARTPSVLLGVSLADAVGDRRPQNLPGTTDEYPNWRVPLCDGDGRSVLLEDLATHQGVADMAATVLARGSGPLGSPGASRPR
jgi:4-alpha-glucanotransferase